MTISRIDLADVGSPERLVIEIFKVEPDLPIPIPVEKLAMQLGIEEIKELDSDGFIGGLITNETKSRGVVLVQRQMKKERRRFTIGHELGHFLIPAHLPGKEDRFLCSMNDLLELDPKIADMRKRWEAEANRFSSLLLVPPHHFHKEANASRDPDLGEIVRLAERYEVSKEVLGRAYVDYREEPVAFVVTRNGQVLRYFYRKGVFPFISVRWGDPVPRASLLTRKIHEESVTSEIEETDAAQWLDVSRGHRAPTLFEQVHRQQQGYALILLSIEPSEDDEDDDSNWNRR